MPKKLFNKLLPSPETIRDHKSLSMISHWIADPSLWHLNRRSVPRAVAVGLFCCFLPIPFQMIVAALLAIIVRSNLALSVVLVWISNPLTMPVMFYGCYVLGMSLFGIHPAPMPDGVTLQWLADEVSQSWLPFIVGCLLAGVFFATLGWGLVNAFWRYHVVKAWRNRRSRQSRD